MTLTDGELDADFTIADTDADGKMSLNELKKYLIPPVPETPPTDPVVPTDPQTPSTNDTVTPIDNSTEPVKNETTPVDSQPVEPGNVLPANATVQEVSDFFRTADTDADGFLTKEEIKAAFVSNGQNLSEVELDAALTKADTDADGKISLDELKNYLVPAVVEPENPPVDPPTPGTNETLPSENDT